MILNDTNRRIVILLFLAVFLLSACSLADEPAPAGPIETGPLPGEASRLAPESTPNVANGAATFAEHCAACHGPTGKGDGPQAATLVQQGAQPPDFSDPAFVRTRSPLDWYGVITTGNMAKFMPPWEQSLTDQERWDAAYFLTTLSTSSSTLDTGKAAYTATCESCHAADGSQNGTTDAAKMALLSPQEIVDQYIVSGTDGVHVFGDTIDESTRWAVVDYVRSLSYTSQQAAQAPTSTPTQEPTAPPTVEPTVIPTLEGTPGTPAPTVEPTIAPTSTPVSTLGSITGIVSNGTPGGADPAGLTIGLKGLELDAASNVSEFLSKEVAIAAGGTYQFDDLPLDRPQSAYVVTVNYGGLDFQNFEAVDPGKPQIDLPVTIYETTSDPSAIKLDAFHVFFSQHPDSLLVVQAMVFSNTGDKAYIQADPLPTGQKASVSFTLPPDADSIGFDSGELGGRFIESGGAIYDTQPVLPGQGAGTISVTYILPYTGGREFSFPVSYPTAQVNILTPVEMQLTGGGFAKGQDRSFQGQNLSTYTLQDVAPGGSISFHVGTGMQPMDVLRIALAALLAILIVTVIVVWFVRRRMGLEVAAAAAVGGEAVDGLLRQIAALDESFRAGKINRLDYEARRAELKAEVAEQIEGEG